jgi:orotate phosphoribosyltransferase
MSQNFQAPSGAIFRPTDLTLLSQLYRAGTFAWKPEGVEFKSGKRSRTYVRGRQELTNAPHLLAELGKRVAEFVRERMPIRDGRQHCLIGVPTAGTKLAVAASMHTYYSRQQSCIIWRELRTKPKPHGEDKGWTVGGPEPSKDVYVVIEQAMSTASSIIEYADHLAEDGYSPREMHYVVLVDRELGGIENMRKDGYKHVHRMFILRDIIAALVHMGLWPLERYQELLQELSLDAEERAAA